MTIDAGQCIIEMQFSWVMPAIASISAVSAAVFAFFSIKSSREMSRKTAATAFMERAVGSVVLKNASEIIREIHTNPDVDVKSFAYSTPSTNLSAEEISKFKERSDAIKIILNYNEHLAIGVKNNIYDETLLKEQRYSSVVDLLDMTKSYIDERRKQSGHHTLYQDFERLADNWKLNKLSTYKK